MMPFSKPLTYLKEIIFAMATSRDLGSALKLIYSTIHFHAWNALTGGGIIEQRPVVDEEAFQVCLDLGFGPHTIWLRRHAGDLYILSRTFVERYHALPGREYPREEIRTIVDLGANIGMSSLAFHARFPRAKILAVEPLAANYQLLCRNVAGIEAIVPVRAAVVGEEAETVRITTAARAWGNRLSAGHLADQEQTEEVPARTLEKLLNENAIERVDLLKVDIEGAEAQLFMRPTFLARVTLVLIELHEPYDHVAFRRDVAPWGFDVVPPDLRAGRRMTLAVRRQQGSRSETKDLAVEHFYKGSQTNPVRGAEEA